MNGEAEHCGGGAAPLGARLALAAAAALVALVLGPQASAHTACTAGAKKVGGVTTRTFCGPAKAQATIHTVDYRFDNGGECSRLGGSWSINIGTITLGPGKPKSSYFGITVFGAHAGTFRNQAVAWQLPGKRFALIGAKITLSAGLKKGTFSGKVFGTNQIATGGFTCSGSL